MDNKSKCCSCGYEWETGKDGSHQCSEKLKARMNKAIETAVRFGQTDGNCSYSIGKATPPDQRK